MKISVIVPTLKPNKIMEKNEALLKKDKRVCEFLVQTEKGVSNARNEGIMRAKGDLLLFLDDDVELSKDPIPIFLKGLKNQKTAGIHGFIDTVPNSFFTTHHYLEQRSEIDSLPKTSESNTALFALGLFRKSALKKAGLFDTKTDAGEDIDLAIRLKQNGFKIMRTTEVVEKHYFEWGCKKVRFYAKGLKYLKEKHGGDFQKYLTTNQTFIKKANLKETYTKYLGNTKGRIFFLMRPIYKILVKLCHKISLLTQ